MTDHQDDWPNLKANSLMKKTSMNDLLGIELEQHSELCKYRACLYYFDYDFVNHYRKRNSYSHFQRQRPLLLAPLKKLKVMHLSVLNNV